MSPIIFDFIFLSEKTVYVSYFDIFSKGFTVWFACYTHLLKQADKQSICWKVSVWKDDLDLNIFENYDNDSLYCLDLSPSDRYSYNYN